MAYLFDSHAHLTIDPVYQEIEMILKRAQLANVQGIINICIDQLSLKRGIALQAQVSGLYNAGATTPHDVAQEGKEMFPFFEKAAKEGKLVAIGETGLDYHYEHSPKDLQQKYLIQYLELAACCALPVIIHCRNAFEDLFALLDMYYKKQGVWMPGVLHCFTGTVKEAKILVDRGWKISLSGIVTFKNSDFLREVAKWVPLSSLFLETDTPYLAPQKYRGKPNEPAYLQEIAACVALEKGIDLEEVVSKTYDNVKNFFSLDKEIGA